MQPKLRAAVSIPMTHLVLMIFAAIFTGTTAQAQGTCTCTCFDGRPQGVCANPGDVAICTPDICPPKPSLLVPLAPRPIPQPTCKNQVVWNPVIKGFEYKEVCTGLPPKLTD